jgi:hypothetical protein
MQLEYCGSTSQLGSDEGGTLIGSPPEANFDSGYHTECGVVKIINKIPAQDFALNASIKKFMSYGPSPPGAEMQLTDLKKNIDRVEKFVVDLSHNSSQRSSNNYIA